MQSNAIIDRLRQPEYTGSNRCAPCTVVNSCIALAVGAGAAAVSIPAGIAVVFLSAVLIYFRGYLVPGTPTLTKRYMPAWALRLFGKEPAMTGGVEIDDDASVEVDPEAFLRDVGAIKPCPDRDDDCLVDEFERRWEATTAEMRASVDLIGLVGDAFGLGAAECEVEEHDDARVLVVDGERVAKWPSRAALIADLAAARIVADRSDRWARLGTVQRGQILRGLRIFLETCPTSDEPVEMGEETVESCCSTRDVVALTCADSGTRLFEQPLGE